MACKLGYAQIVRQGAIERRDFPKILTCRPSVTSESSAHHMLCNTTCVSSLCSTKHQDRATSPSPVNRGILCTAKCTTSLPSWAPSQGRNHKPAGETPSIIPQQSICRQGCIENPQQPLWGTAPGGTNTPSNISGAQTYRHHNQPASVSAPTQQQ